MKTFSKVSDFKNKIGTIPVGQGLVVLKCSVVLIVQHRIPDIKYARLHLKGQLAMIAICFFIDRNVGNVSSMHATGGMILTNILLYLTNLLSFKDSEAYQVIF